MLGHRLSTRSRGDRQYTEEELQQFREDDRREQEERNRARERERSLWEYDIHRPGMSPQDLTHILKVRYGNAREQVECVCGENLAEGDNVKFLPCAHVFHAVCIDKWLAQKAHCPYDRYTIT